jgi:hypothetical protein
VSLAERQWEDEYTKQMINSLHLGRIRRHEQIHVSGEEMGTPEIDLLERLFVYASNGAKDGLSTDLQKTMNTFPKASWCCPCLPSS